MCCFLTIFALFGPRLANIVWWIAQPARWDKAFESALWPVLGIIFAPWTTLMWVAVSSAGVNGFDWFWVVLGVLADVASYSGGAWGNRDRLPGSSQPSQPSQAA
jgi:hypothetical protein